MNKSQKKQIEIAKQYIALGMIDGAARAVSALIRCALTSKSKAELLDFAQEHNLTTQPDFII